MKSQAELSARFARQWHQSSLRVGRLMTPEAWPIHLSIGKPSASQFEQDAKAVLEHVQHWRSVKIGEVEWLSVKYRAGADAVSVPIRWILRKPSEWVVATADQQVETEFRVLENLIENAAPVYHELLIQERSLWRSKSLEEVLEAIRLAGQLSPGCAQGLPFRLLAGHNVDTKFFERNARLLTRLLDERYQGAASEQGLSGFLNAYDENNHWVTVVPLTVGLLPFRRLKVTTLELSEIMLPASRILVIENEQCAHLLPVMPDTIAILGAGLDLQWLGSYVFNSKQLAYWGDMDTWGLQMLGKARQLRPDINPLLMNQSVFDRYADGRVVAEPVLAQADPPDGLNRDEKAFYQYLMNLEKGRLEQEFLPADALIGALTHWVG